MSNSNSNFVDIYPCEFQAMNQEHSSTSIARYNRDEKPVTYTLKFQSFSLLKDVGTRFESQIFIAGGYKWKLALYPNGDAKRNGSDHISIYLVIADHNILSTYLEVKAVFIFLLYDNLTDKYLTIEDGKIRRFSANRKTEWGIDKLIPLEIFNDPSNGFLVDDFCVFGVDICVMRCDDGKGEVFSLIKQPEVNKYTWKVHNFSQLDKKHESDPFNLESYSWKIQLYPKGDSRAKSDFLSLFLILDSIEKLPKNYQVYVNYELTILSQFTIHEHKISAGKWFKSGGDGWGCADFMSLTKLKDATKGFLCKDTMNIEVKLNVISNLKKIE